MKEFIEKLINGLEEYKYSHLLEHNSEECLHCQENEDDWNCFNRNCLVCVCDSTISIVNALAGEYKGNDYWKIIYNKVCDIEKKYSDCGNIESVNDCIKLENLLQYFKEELRSVEERENDFCEWEVDGVYLMCQHKTELFVSCLEDEKYRYKHCPICGKKIKVVE